MYQSNNDNGDTSMLADDRAVFTIGMVAEMLKVHPRTIRNYEANGLITPFRKGSWRYYTMRDVQWLECLREMIHSHGVSINAIKKLLKYTPCWNIIDCPFEKRKRCSAFFSNSLIPTKIERIHTGSAHKGAVA
ncbi:MerR family transcriptional regulator [Desulfopila sp. IMCC35008]|uniref:MerR family transcriptional regulator n=1 Tax=Desulfopila sp. IMCC35008 TaxID=2653858 RepID=UPI001F0F1A51|nr:MerR family transcriptional regulator [Desulfopila sp. IMCC35008]